MRLRVVTMLGAALSASAAVTASGCDQWLAGAGEVTAEPQQPTDHPQFLLAEADQASDSDRIVVVQMQFDVLRVELPADDIHHSQKTWNYVDELGGDPTRTALLRRNGFRMGTACADSWPALRAMFEACQARVLRATHVVQRGLPLTLELDSVERDEPIFLLTTDNRMVGRTLNGGQKYLHVDYALEVDGERTVTVQVTPEIHLLGAVKFGTDDQGNLRQARRYEGLVFHELSHTLDLAAGEFLVIGPDAGSTGLSVGRRFLTRKHQGRTYETVLCIIPQPFRTEVVRR